MIEEKYKQLDLKNWKEFQEVVNITTNSRWLQTKSDNRVFGNFFIPDRKYLPKSASDHHGIWISEIPFQMIIRYTKKDDLVWSQFGGSGVDYEVCKLLDRKCYINDLNPKREYIIKEDTLKTKLENKADLILSHPPYFDIVKYSDDENDGQQKKSLMEFLLWWKEIAKNSYDNLKEDGFMVVACGNIYKNSEEIELGQLLLNICLNNGFILKQHIIKDYGETKGSQLKNYNINYYRQLKGKYGNFYGDNIYVLQKRKSKNRIDKILKQILD